MKLNKLEQAVSETLYAKIYIAGPIEHIEQICRKYVMRGLCVTVTKTNYIFTGGEQTGVEIGLINYPRFPTIQEKLTDQALELGKIIMEKCCQMSFTVMTPKKTIFISRREKIDEDTRKTRNK